MLATQGIRVLRFSDRDVLLDIETVEETIWLALGKIAIGRRS